MKIEDILSLEKILKNFFDYNIIFQNHYESPSIINFSVIHEIVIRPYNKSIIVRIGTTNDIEEL